MVALKLFSLLLVCCFCIYKAVTTYRRAQEAKQAKRTFSAEDVVTTLARLETTTIAAATVGTTVKLEGKARAVEDCAVSPLSKTPCVFYRIVVKQFGDGETDTLLDLKQGAELWLEDGTGSAHVRPSGTADSLHVRAQYGTGAGHVKRNEDALRELLEKRGFDPAAKVVAYERFIAEGDTITIAGEVREHQGEAPPAGGSYREAPRTIAVVGTEEMPLLLAPESLKPTRPLGVKGKNGKKAKQKTSAAEETPAAVDRSSG